MIALPLSQRRGNYLLWFRPQWRRDVAWGDNGLAPSGAPAVDDRLAPSGSFRTWAESVEGSSRPWNAAEIEATGRLRTAVGTFLLERAEQLAALNTELARSNARSATLATLRKSGDLGAASVQMCWMRRAPGAVSNPGRRKP